jgi:hypothetical protein
LYYNNGDGTFTNISKSAGFTTEMWSAGAAFGDFNRDGLLDLYVINYIEEPNPLEDENGVTIGFNHDCYPDELYINNGDLTFTEVSAEYSVDNPGCGLAVAFTDYNNDQITDIYIANDFGQWIVPNIMYKNKYPELSFEDIAPALGINAGIFGMGIAIGDYNRDARLDYYVTNIGQNVLYQHNADGSFSDMTIDAGVEAATYNGLNSTGWGTAFFDYNHDGYEDLILSNGYIPSAKFIETTDIDPNKLFKNNGNGTFTDVSMETGFHNEEICRGLAISDFDNDGDMDVAVAKLGQIRDTEGNMLFYRNNLEDKANWLKVQVEGVECNKDGFGSMIRIYSEGIPWIHEIEGGSSHASQNSSIAHFGLGQYDFVDSLLVFWPDGDIQRFYDVSSNQTLFIREGENDLYIAGCMDTEAENYNPLATYNTGCYKKVPGCTDPEADNFSLEANVDNGSCKYNIVYGCKDPEASNYNPNATIDDGSCTYVTALMPDSNKKKDIIIYPNPASENIVIELSGAEKSDQMDFTLFDLQGKRVVDNHRLPTKTIEIKLPVLKPGVYFYEITLGGLRVENGKLFIQHK